MLSLLVFRTLFSVFPIHSVLVQTAQFQIWTPVFYSVNWYPVQFLVVKTSQSVSAMFQTHSVQHFFEQPVEHFHLWFVSVVGAGVCWTLLTQCLLVHYHLLSNTSVHHLWLMHLPLQHLPVLSVLLLQTVRRMLSLANSILAIAPSCHRTRQAVAVLHFFQRQCLQSWPLLSSVVAGVSAPLPWKV